jgi:hypothetical protein
MRGQLSDARPFFMIEEGTVVLPHRPHTLSLHIPGCTTSHLYHKPNIQNLLIPKFNYTTSWLYQTWTYHHLKTAQPKYPTSHLYQTLIYNVTNIPNLFLPCLICTKLYFTMSWICLSIILSWQEHNMCIFVGASAQCDILFIECPVIKNYFPEQDFSFFFIFFMQLYNFFNFYWISFILFYIFFILLDDHCVKISFDSDNFSRLG